MKESELKTSPKQRILIAVVAALMLGASLAIYVAVIVSANSSTSTTSDSTTTVDEAKIAELTAEYEAKSAEYEELSSAYSSKYLEEFSQYRSEVKAFNAASVNESTSVQVKDLKIGNGANLTATSSGYGAFYIGWCPDETVFDSSFDNFESPSKLNAPIIVNQDALIEGWYLGVDGMKLNGARTISIPSTLAYGESEDICGEANSPLKFVVMPIEVDEKLTNLASELSTIYMKILYAQYGMEYTE